MFDVAKVQKEVTAKICTLRNVDENTIHMLYRAAIVRELSAARQNALGLESWATHAVQVQGAQTKWRMVTAEGWETLCERIRTLANMMAG